MSVKNVACVGAGLIGASWAVLFAKGGCIVRLYDAFPEHFDTARSRISGFLSQLLEHGVLTENDISEIWERITFHEDLAEAIQGVDFIQESVPELLDVKQKILAEIDEINTTAILASSTSSMKISDISENSEYAGRCIGAHPYNPPHLVPLVEITKSVRTEAGTIEAAIGFYDSMKKVTVVLQKEATGFIGNRLQEAIAREAINIIMLGIANLDDVDKAVVYGLGLRWAIIGPNMTRELNGGTEGIKGFYTKFGESVGNILQDNMAAWHSIPDEFIEKLGPEGIETAKLNRPPELGNTNEDIARYRDNMLIELLKLHNKI